MEIIRVSAMDVNEKICIQDYNPLWKFYYEKEKILIENNLKNISIEHIGSTSIEGMKAKPIIDILIGVNNFPPDQDVIAILQKIGYTYMKGASVVDRLYFVKRDAISFNVHIVEKESNIWKTDLAFRDYMCGDADEKARYAALKTKIINSGVDTLLEYSALKADYILGINNLVMGIHVQTKNTNLDKSKRTKVLSLQGCMASGKTTALKFIENNAEDIFASYEWDDEITNVLNQHNYDKSVLGDYIEVQKIWIDKEIRRYIKATEMKSNCVVMDFGAEEIEFHTLYWPRTIGQAWDVEKYLHRELEELRKCFPDRILFLMASEEKLRSNKLNDSTRQRRYFEYYLNKIMPLKEEWLKGLNNVDYLVVDNLSQEQLGEETLNWVRMQL